MSAVITGISTAHGFKHAIGERHPKLYTRARVRVPRFFAWLWSDPFIGKEGLVIGIRWDVELSASLYTLLFGDSDSGVQRTYLGRNLEFLED